MLRLGVVSYLNSKPLVEGLAETPNLRLTFDVPARLAERLEAGEFDAALIPIVDVLRSEGRLTVISDGCIGCDGETMTVRVFSQIPPDRIRRLYVDGDSHTSCALSRVLWRELYERDLELIPLESTADIGRLESVLLIGDKVVQRRRGFAYEVDLGGAWRQHTGLPFVFAAWATQTERANDTAALADLLSAARDRGVARAEWIAEQEGPKRWWPVDLAKRYLMECLKFTLDARYMEGADRFAELCVLSGAAPTGATITWQGRRELSEAANR